MAMTLAVTKDDLVSIGLRLELDGFKKSEDKDGLVSSIFKGLKKEDNVKRITVEMLKDVCDLLDLKVSGTKAELVERIRKAVKAVKAPKAAAVKGKEEKKILQPKKKIGELCFAAQVDAYCHTAKSVDVLRV